MKNNFTFFKITGAFPIMVALLLTFLFSPVAGWGQITLTTQLGTIVTISGLPAPLCGSDVGAYTCDGCLFNPFVPGPSQTAPWYPRPGFRSMATTSVNRSTWRQTVVWKTW